MSLWYPSSWADKLWTKFSFVNTFSFRSFICVGFQSQMYVPHAHTNKSQQRETIFFLYCVNDNCCIQRGIVQWIICGWNHIIYGFVRYFDTCNVFGIYRFVSKFIWYLVSVRSFMSFKLECHAQLCLFFLAIKVSDYLSNICNVILHVFVSASI